MRMDPQANGCARVHPRLTVAMRDPHRARSRQRWKCHRGARLLAVAPGLSPANGLPIGGTAVITEGYGFTGDDGRTVEALGIELSRNPSPPARGDAERRRRLPAQRRQRPTQVAGQLSTRHGRRRILHDQNLGAKTARRRARRFDDRGSAHNDGE